MQKYVIALYIRLSIEDYKYDSFLLQDRRNGLWLPPSQRCRNAPRVFHGGLG